MTQVRCPVWARSQGQWRQKRRGWSRGWEVKQNEEGGGGWAGSSEAKISRNEATTGTGDLAGAQLPGNQLLLSSATWEMAMRSSGATQGGAKTSSHAP